MFNTLLSVSYISMTRIMSNRDLSTIAFDVVDNISLGRNAKVVLGTSRETGTHLSVMGDKSIL